MEQWSLKTNICAQDISITQRPMTSVAGAGFSSKPGAPRAFDPLKQQGAAPALADKADNSPEDLAKKMERQVNTLIEASADG